MRRKNEIQAEIARLRGAVEFFEKKRDEIELDRRRVMESLITEHREKIHLLEWALGEREDL